MFGESNVDTHTRTGKLPFGMQQILLVHAKYVTHMLEKVSKIIAIPKVQVEYRNPNLVVNTSNDKSQVSPQSLPHTNM